jgi:hypothetical protein
MSSLRLSTIFSIHTYTTCNWSTLLSDNFHTYTTCNWSTLLSDNYIPFLQSRNRAVLLDIIVSVFAYVSWYILENRPPYHLLVVFAILWDSVSFLVILRWCTMMYHRANLCLVRPHPTSYMFNRKSWVPINRIRFVYDQNWCIINYFCGPSRDHRSCVFSLLKVQRIEEFWIALSIHNKHNNSINKLPSSNQHACVLPWLCARSWLARHPAKIEITGSSGGSSNHTKIGVEAPNSYSLTSWPELIVVIHGEYIPPGTHAVNLLEGRVARTPGSTRHRLEL